MLKLYEPVPPLICVIVLVLFSSPATTEIYTLSLHDALPISNTVGDEDFQPLLAQRWEWDGPLTLVFHIDPRARDRKSTRLNSSHVKISYADFCLKKNKDAARHRSGSRDRGYHHRQPRAQDFE